MRMGLKTGYAFLLTGQFSPRVGSQSQRNARPNTDGPKAMQLGLHHPSIPESLLVIAKMEMLLAQAEEWQIFLSS